MGLGSWLRKKSKAERASPGLPIKFKLAIWYAAKWFKDGLAGKKGEDVMEFLKKVQGLRSAILLAFLLLEGLAHAFGFNAGPLFAVLKGFFASIGWSADPSTADLATTAVTTIAGAYFVYQRFMAWLAEQKAKPAQP